MQVLDEDHFGLLRTLRPLQARQRGEEGALPRLGTHLGRRALGACHAEELKDQRQRVRQRRVEPEQAARDLLARALLVVRVVDAEVAAPQVERCRERDPARVRERVRLARDHSLTS